LIRGTGGAVLFIGTIVAIVLTIAKLCFGYAPVVIAFVFCLWASLVF